MTRVVNRAVGEIYDKRKNAVSLLSTAKLWCILNTKSNALNNLKNYVYSVMLHRRRRR